MVPFHTWLPDAAGQAPAGAAVLIVGVLDKVGTVRDAAVLPGALPWRGQVGHPGRDHTRVIGIVYGAVLAIARSTSKRLIAYTSISHFGFIILGIFRDDLPGAVRRDALPWSTTASPPRRCS